MAPRQVCKTVYKFDELPAEVQEKAVEKWNEHGLDYEWWDAVYEDAKTIGALMGITITNIYFSGFWSQGDGACFEGSYEFQKGAVKAVKEHAPQDAELHRIAQELHAVNARAFYRLSASVKQRGHYNHEYCTDINVSDDRYSWFVADDLREGLADALRDFMRWIYRQLEKEYEYQTSFEAVAETIRANDYDFDEAGNLV